MKSFSVAAAEYTTPADFCRMFEQDMKRLYLLSLLLTAGRQSAEQCFISSLADCLDMRPVFKDWTDFSTRHIVLRNAIRMLRPAAHKAAMVSPPRPGRPDPDLSPALRAVLRLNTFERFVFVMSVLEGYSDRDCSLLLGSSTREVVAAKAKALEYMGKASGPNDLSIAALGASFQASLGLEWESRS
jgi:DNA-directed RNA polymerase specialized sigma24 family protein